MQNFSNIGRIFYGTAIAVTGFLTIYFKDFHPYLLPPNHSWVPDLIVVARIFGTILILGAVCIVFKIKIRQIALLLGVMFLLIGCFYYIPYEFLSTPNYIHLGDWENVEKELAYSCGALVIAGCFSGYHEKPFFGWLGKLVPFATILFSITIITFGMDHFLYSKDVSAYVPSWVPDHLIWTYFFGTALIGLGIGITLNIRRRFCAALLGSMIFLWFITLHIPRVIASSSSNMGDELISAFLALAYSGIAFAIAGSAGIKEKGIGPLSDLLLGANQATQEK